MSGKRIKNIRVKKGYKHYCANCGKGPFFTHFPLDYSRNVMCSKECEDAFYPIWLRWTLGLIVFGAWAAWLLDLLGVIAFF